MPALPALLTACVPETASDSLPVPYDISQPCSARLSLTPPLLTVVLGRFLSGVECLATVGRRMAGAPTLPQVHEVPLPGPKLNRARSITSGSVSRPRDRERATSWLD